MCELRTAYFGKKIKGFKIVVKKLKGKRYFSAAMGFKYPLDGHIPVVRWQRRISSGYKDNIIEKYSHALRDDMIGRTAIFPNFNGVYTEYRYLQGKNIEEGYKIVVVQVELSVDMMEGVYGGRKVVAGRHIRFIKEVEATSGEEYRNNPYQEGT